MKGVEIKFKMPNLAKRMREHKHEIWLAMAAVMQTNRAMIFANEGAYNGRAKWKPLKMRKGMILSDTGALRRSLAPGGLTRSKKGRVGPGGILDIRDGLVKLNSTLPYARLQDKGGIVRPKAKEALAFPNGKGGMVFTKKVTIPARPFSDITEKDKEEFARALEGILEGILNR